MVIKTFKKFNEETMFSFFKGKNSIDISTNSLIGKVVCVDTNVKSSDGFTLKHVYQIEDDNGKVGRFLGNIKSKGRVKYFKKTSGRSIIEKIEGWEYITPSELKLL